MDEHDDDLESTVDEGADQETDGFPDTVDDLDDLGLDTDDDEELDLDEDKSEL